MNKALFALAAGAFGFCASEYVMLGVLGDVSAVLHLSVARSGNFLSAYALGVAAGALLTGLLARKRPPKNTLLWLAAWFALGNLLTAICDGYLSLLSARFFSGLPHGGFFTVAALFAERLAVPDRRAGAVAAMFSGMTAATLAAVPLGTFLSHIMSWRVAYLAIGLWGLISFWATDKYLPILPAGRYPVQIKEETGFLAVPSVWLLLGGVVLGNGGIFCWLSYISPALTRQSGIPAHYMGAIMALIGLGMLLGNWAGARDTERSGALKTALRVQAAACAVLVLIFFFPLPVFLSCTLAFLCAGLMFALTVPEQMLLISAAPAGALLGSAVAQAGFYLGNTIGATGGGLALREGLGYGGCALTGAVMGAAGWLCLAAYAAVCGRQGRPDTIQSSAQTQTARGVFTLERHRLK